MCVFCVSVCVHVCQQLYGMDGWAPYLLLQQTTNVLFCAYVYLYSRMLLARPFDLRSFRWIQEAMALGDIVILCMCIAQGELLENAKIEVILGTAAMAFVWGSARSIFLVLTRNDV